MLSSSHFAGVELNLKTLAQNLKTRASELMAEIAPWARDFPLNSNDIRTKLEITKYKGKNVRWETSDYMELFEETQPQAKINCSAFHKLRKVLVKGRLEQGKSTLTKKIVLDWAQGRIKIYRFVFFVSIN